jgi:hypothetical protein
MDKKHYHIPLPSRPLCPVCKKAVYSRAGIHPQCAMIQADPLRPIKKLPLGPGEPVVGELSLRDPPKASPVLK